MGLLEAGHVVLRHALRILGVLRLGARVAGVRIAVRVEGRTGCSAGVARRDTPRLSGANGLIGLTLHPCYRVDIGGPSQAGGGYDQGNAKHHRHDEMFHGVLPKNWLLRHLLTTYRHRRKFRGRPAQNAATPDDTSRSSASDAISPLETPGL